MELEFHYYITYLIATKAGLGPDDALILATASQYTDDNDTIFEIDKGKDTGYQNHISQTMNILKPKAKLFRIYPIFHFIPGEPKNRTAWRKDGKMHWLTTTPNSKNANRIFDAALADGDLYRIGLAAHGYADTWAHQNFVGYHDGFNAMAGALDQLVPNIGHADAGYHPDWVALVWRDKRLIRDRVDNRERFLHAARQLLGKLARYADPRITTKALGTQAASLRKALNRAIGPQDQSNAFKEERIHRYRELSSRPGFGERDLKVYDEDQWLEQAVNQKVRGRRDRSDASFLRWDPLTDHYTWKDPRNYKKSHWYRFQEAVKRHQEETWGILLETNLKGLELPQL